MLDKFWRLAAFAAALAMFGGGHAFAQDDRCSDILVNGTLQASRHIDNAYFRQTLAHRYYRSSYAESQSDQSGGLSIPIGEVFVGADYSASDHSIRRDQIRQAYNLDTVMNRDIDVALTSGDPTIVAAWTQCMRSRGGVIFYMSALTGRDAVATIDFAPVAGLTSATLTRDVTIPPGVEIVSGSDCLKSGQVIISTAACEAGLRVQDARTSVVLTLPTSAGSKSAFLAPRVRLESERRNFPLQPLYYALRGRQVSTQSTLVTLPDVLVNDGWSFDLESFDPGKLEVLRAYEGSTCNQMSAKASAFTVRYGFRHVARDTNSTTRCQIKPVIQIRRERLVPME